MLFGRTRQGADGELVSGLPGFLDELLQLLSVTCRPYVEERVWRMLFLNPDLRSRQVILNRYLPGEGISSHVDLLQRYDDGIIGVSLGSGCAMEFTRVCPISDEPNHSIWLPESSVVILEGDARYKWAHGIKGLHGDCVLEEGAINPIWIPRRTRTSITLRWMLPNADLVGQE